MKQNNIIINVYEKLLYEIASEQVLLFNMYAFINLLG
jgi:hypothetical protein